MFIRHARAAFVVFHVVAILAMAIPSPTGGLRRSTWADPTVQAEFDAWSARLTGLGVAMDDAQLEDWAWRFATRYHAARNELLKPFRPYYHTFGTEQSWRMFVAPHRFPSRLELAVDRGSGFEVVYVARSETHTWLRTKLDHDRFRASIFRYAWPPYRGAWRDFVAWAGRQALHDFPDATRLRARFLRQRTPSADEVRRGFEPPVAPHSDIVLDLRELGRAPKDRP